MSGMRKRRSPPAGRGSAKRSRPNPPLEAGGAGITDLESVISESSGPNPKFQQLLDAVLPSSTSLSELQTAIAATQACRRLLVVFAERFPTTRLPCRKARRALRKQLQAPKTSPADRKHLEFQIWTIEQRGNFQSSCLESLRRQENEVVLQSTLTALLELVRLEGGPLDPGQTESTASLWHRIVLALLLRPQPLSNSVWKDILGKFFLRHGDLALHILQSLSFIAKQASSPAAWSAVRAVLGGSTDGEQDPQHTREIFTRSLLKLLLLLSQISQQQPAVAPAFRGNPKLWLASSAAAVEPKTLQRKLSDLWIAYLQIEGLSSTTCLAVLQFMKSVILPSLERPIVVADFLVDAYNLSGLVALLALDGLFFLIHQHNLDYPEFYSKLYSLLAPPSSAESSTSASSPVRNDLFLHIEHRTRLYELLPVFLSSSYLPQHFVASFVKRMARLSVTLAPPDFAVFSISLSFGLLKRHPTLKSLVHRKLADKRVRIKEATHNFFRLLAPAPQASDALLAEGPLTQDKNGLSKPRSDSAGEGEEGKEKAAENELGSDPFDPEENDLTKTRALDSSLWELRALEKHYSPLVARQAKLFFDGFGITKPGSHLSKEALKTEAVVQETLEKNVKGCPLSYDGLFDLELKWRKNQRMPLAFESHKQLFPVPEAVPSEETPSAAVSAVLSYTPKCFSGELFRVSVKL